MNVDCPSTEPGEFRSLSLCAGYGGLDIALDIAVERARTVCYVEREAASAGVLAGAMENGCMAPAPVWSDLRTFNARAWRGVVHLVSAGYPCQPFSHAGNRAGETDDRHLWPDVHRVLVESGAAWGFFENVFGHISLGLDQVLDDLRVSGFLPVWDVFSAAQVGASHRRQRVFILAVNPDRLSERRRDGRDETGNAAPGDRRHPDTSREGLDHGDGPKPGSGIQGVEELPGGRGNRPTDDRDPVVDNERSGRQRRVRDADPQRREEPARPAPGTDGELVGADCRGRDGGVLEQGVDRAAPAGGGMPEPPGRRALLADGDRVDDQRQRDPGIVPAPGAGTGVPASGQPTDAAAERRVQRLGLFAPHQNDAAWREIIERDITLAPALPRVSGAQLEAVPSSVASVEREIRRVVDGGTARVDQLAMLGNGVCPIQGAVAFLALLSELAHRTGLDLWNSLGD